VNFERLDYRTTDGSLYIDFVLMDCGPDIGWRVYIINLCDADYAGRDTGGHATHRNHFSGDTYKSICWSTRINTFDEAKAVAAAWGNTTALYIQNGGSFDDIAKRLSEQ